MQDFSGGESTCPTLKFLGIWIYMPRAAKLRAVAGGVWGHAPEENFLKWCNSCVLRAIFNHFHDKKFSQKFMNKQDFFN